MGKIVFINYDNTEYVAELEPGTSLMQTAVNNGIPGIDGDCGGDCACGTCHVIVAAEWFEKLGDPGDEERELLEMTPERSETSRLGCQVEMSEAMDGMTVHLPEFQM